MPRNVSHCSVVADGTRKICCQTRESVDRDMREVKNTLKVLLTSSNDHGKLMLGDYQAQEQHLLPQLRFSDGTVLIKLDNDPSQWLLLHESVPREKSPYSAAALHSDWQKSTKLDRIIHPTTGNPVSIKILALKFVDQTYFLEGKSIELHTTQNVRLFRAQHWPEEWRFGKPRMKTALNRCQTALHAFFALLYGAQLTCEQLGGLSERLYYDPEEIEGTAELNGATLRQVVEVCAYADYFRCLHLLGPTVMGILRSSNRFWRAVAYNPLQYLLLARKAKDTEVYFDALRHASKHTTLKSP